MASHPHALAQCRGWIAELLPGADAVPTASTAEAAAAGRRRRVRRHRLRADRRPALRARRARHDVADHPGAVTRFVLVQRPGPLPAPTGNDKTSLVAVITDRTGALLELLASSPSGGSA